MFVTRLAKMAIGGDTDEEINLDNIEVQGVA
jgi:hypothetical protein